MMKYPDDFINKVIQGDCLEVMKQMPDKCVDLVVTSPPYNLGNGHHTGNIKHKAYDDDLNEDDYQKAQVEVLDETHRILVDNGSVFYNHKNRIKDGLAITPYEWILKTKFKLKQELIWFNGSQNFDKVRFYPMTERIYWLAKTGEVKLENKINHHDLFEWASEGTDKEHTRSFPLELPKSFITCFPEAKVVFDPYCGSGTTAVAAKQLGRKYIGIELSEKYCEIANQRLRQEVLL